MQELSVTNELNSMPDNHYKGKILTTMWKIPIWKHTNLWLSSDEFLIQGTRWRKDKIPYHERTCFLCMVHDVQDEYHIALICEYFKEVKKKYVKQY